MGGLTLKFLPEVVVHERVMVVKSKPVFALSRLNLPRCSEENIKSGARLYFMLWGEMKMCNIWIR